MPIKIASVTPIKKILGQADPTGDTWVMIKPITYRDDMLRGEYLKDGRVVADAVAGLAQSTSVNPYSLRAVELWLTYAEGRIVVEQEDGTTEEPFGPREEMTQERFMQALGSLAPAVVLEWYEKMLEVNPDWRFPF